MPLSTVVLVKYLNSLWKRCVQKFCRVKRATPIAEGNHEKIAMSFYIRNMGPICHLANLDLRSVLMLFRFDQLIQKVGLDCCRFRLSRRFKGQFLHPPIQQLGGIEYVLRRTSQFVNPAKLAGTMAGSA